MFHLLLEGRFRGRRWIQPKGLCGRGSMVLKRYRPMGQISGPVIFHHRPGSGSDLHPEVELVFELSHPRHFGLHDLFPPDYPAPLALPFLVPATVYSCRRTGRSQIPPLKGMA